MKVLESTGSGCRITPLNSLGGSTLHGAPGQILLRLPLLVNIVCLDIGDRQPGIHGHQSGNYRLHHRHRSILR